MSRKILTPLNTVMINDDWSPLHDVVWAWDISDRTSFNTIFWDKITAKKIDMISIKFDSWIIADDFDITQLNGATATESNSRLLLQSSTATNWSVVLETKDKIRYRPWHDIYSYFTYAWLDWWVAGSKNIIWPNTNQNWYYLGFNWTNFVVWRRKAWIDDEITWVYFIDNLDWNWPSKFNINYTKINIFRCTFGYLWIAPAFFEIYWWKQKWWINFAYIDLINESDQLSIESPNLPIRAEITKTSWNTNVRWISWSWYGWYYNGWEFNVWNRPNHYDTDLWKLLTWTTWTPNPSLAVVTFRLKTTFNWKPNRATAKLVHWDYNNTASWDNILMKIIANPTSVWGTAVWSLTYADIDTSNSMVEYSTNSWVVVWWKTIYSQYMMWWGSWQQAKAWWWQISAEELWLLWRPWDTFTVIYKRVSGTWDYTALLNMNWIELF